MPSPRESKHARKSDPQGPGTRNQLPYDSPAGQLNRLLAVARQTPDTIGAHSARLWWPALLLTLLDTALSLRELLAVKVCAYDPATGTLSVGLLNYTLHPRAADALCALVGIPEGVNEGVNSPFVGAQPNCDQDPAPSEPEMLQAEVPTAATGEAGRNARLFGWSRRDLRPLTDRFERLAALAELPRPLRTFDALRSLARTVPNAANLVDPSFEFFPKFGKQLRGEPVAPFPELVNITLPENLFQFFDDHYAPRQLADATHGNRLEHRRALVLLSRYLACDPTFANLNLTTVEAFVNWLQRAGLAPSTIDRHRSILVSVWQLAYATKRTAQRPAKLPALCRRPPANPRPAAPRAPRRKETHPPESLFTFFDQTYTPQRLAGLSAKTVSNQRAALVRFREFLNCEPTLFHLNDDTVERFASWLEAGIVSRARDYRAVLVAISNQARLTGAGPHLQPIPARPTARPERGTHKVPFPELVAISLPDNLLRYFDDVYAPRRLADSSRLTILDYRRVLVEFSWFLACEPTFANLNDDTVEGFLAWLKQSGTKQNPTINKYRRNLLAIWNYAWRKNKVAEQPRDIVELRELKRLPEAWSPAVVGKILAAAKALPDWVEHVPAAVWWPALILTAYDTGLRIDALMRVRRSQFERSTRWLTVSAETQKQKADQLFQVHPETVDALAALDAYFAKPREFLFPWPFDGCQTNARESSNYQALRRQYRRILSAAGLPTGSRDLFHKLRRTSATAICNRFDIEAARQHLGHSSINVTKRYLDPRLIAPKGKTAADSIARPTWSPVPPSTKESA